MLGATALAGCSGAGEPSEQDSSPISPDEEGAQAAPPSGGSQPAPQVDGETPIFDVIDHPLFEGFGRLLFPISLRPPTADMTLADLPECLPWYSCIHTETTVDVVNYLLGRRAGGGQVFFDIYTEDERSADPSLSDTGLFFFPAEGTEHGSPAPFAIVSAGGGFAYVASMHDSFPHALHLARSGVNGFALQYRPDAQLACQDLARAVEFVVAHADGLGVDPQGYSLWGGSAGARMAAYVGGLGPTAFGGDAPQPAAVIMQYTGHREITGADPPTYACVGDRDGIANWRTMLARLEALSQQGVPTEFHVYEGLHHGFGLGIGTVAEGWIDDARAFWLAHRNVEALERRPAI